MLENRKLHMKYLLLCLSILFYTSVTYAQPAGIEIFNLGMTKKQAIETCKAHDAYMLHKKGTKEYTCSVSKTDTMTESLHLEFCGRSGLCSIAYYNVVDLTTTYLVGTLPYLYALEMYRHITKSLSEVYGAKMLITSGALPEAGWYWPKSKVTLTVKVIRLSRGTPYAVVTTLIQK